MALRMANGLPTVEPGAYTMSATYRAARAALGTMLFLGSGCLVRAQDANRDVVVTKAAVGDIVQRLARQSGGFKEEFHKAIEHSMIDGTRLEQRARHRADDLHATAKKLQDVFHDKKDKNNPAVRDQVDRTLAAGADVNRIMQDHRFTDKLQRNWDLLRSDLNALAAVYNLSPL
ncbi:MAG: hypothetical protein LAP87_10210 [Acidobacteriia bacterium]|nr:hypothetical protein [Terriglobia bacterium]